MFKLSNIQFRRLVNVIHNGNLVSTSDKLVAIEDAIGRGECVIISTTPGRHYVGTSGVVTHSDTIEFTLICPPSVESKIDIGPVEVARIRDRFGNVRLAFGSLAIF